MLKSDILKLFTNEEIYTVSDKYYYPRITTDKLKILWPFNIGQPQLDSYTESMIYIYRVLIYDLLNNTKKVFN